MRLSERFVDQFVLLFVEDLGRAGRRARGRGTADVAQSETVAEVGEPLRDVRPGAHVPGLLLHPDEVRGSPKGVEGGAEPGRGKRRELLDADDRDARVP